MSRCHECNSEVAENDVFCPFCGVRQMAAAAAAAGAGESHPVNKTDGEDLANATTEPDIDEIPTPDLLVDADAVSVIPDEKTNPELAAPPELEDDLSYASAPEE